MMYLMVGISACMAIFSAVQAVNAKRRGKNGLRLVWWLLTVAFAVCFVLSAMSVLS